MLPYILCFDLYPGYFFVPTRFNSSDDPSRFTKLRSPTLPLPTWFDAAADGDPAEFDFVASWPKQAKDVSGWIRMTWKICRLKGVNVFATLNFDASLGFPGEGPPKGSRDPQLLAQRGHVPEVLLRRQRYLERFVAWLWKSRGLSLDALFDKGSRAVDRVLASYGAVCFEGGRSHIFYTETICAVTDRVPELKRSLPRAWDLGWVWKGLQESSNNLAMPQDVLLAAVATALFWDWDDVALLMYLGFICMLRPGELCALRFQDIVFSTVRGAKVAFIFIGLPKMRRIGPRREHVRIDDSELVQALAARSVGRPAGERLYLGTSFQFALNFRSIIQALRLPISQGHGMTPACLRSGGATFWYQLTDSTEYVRFRGRWSNSRMLEVYIQEVGACTFLSQQPAPVREHVALLAAAGPWLFAERFGLSQE